MKTSKKVQEDDQKVIDRELDWRVRDGHKPTRTFEVGERVIYGNHDNCEILEKHYDGAVYKVHCFGFKNVYGVQKEYEDFYTVAWYKLIPLSASKETKFRKTQDFFIRNSNTVISSLLSKVLSDHAGVDFSPDYQRDYVWTEEDKIKLIDSIFNNISIGSFLFAKKEFKENDKGYEIIDGKQRLTALVEFFEDRFPYKGVYFSELSPLDADHFENFTVLVGELENCSHKQKLQAFLSVNTTGKVMDEKHLDKVREELESLK